MRTPTVVAVSCGIVIMYALVCLVASYAAGPPIAGASYWFALTLIAALGALIGNDSARVLLLWVCGLNVLGSLVLLLLGSTMGLPVVGEGSGWRTAWLLMTAANATVTVTNLICFMRESSS